MKILLDESLPRKLRYDFEETHEVITVRDKGWLGKKNGELFKLIAEEKFELFVTVDRNLSYQQNLEKIPFIIIVLHGVDNRRETLKLLIQKLFIRLADNRLQKVIEIS
jgi:predicted nuclease of predicted toxin-antitoxin system